MRLAHKPGILEKPPAEFTHAQFPQARYTASYSYRLEAALDREWERTYRNGKLLLEKLSTPSREEGGRA